MPYPNLQHNIEELLKEHQQNRETPLLLAIYFRFEQHPDDDCVMEVLDHFGDDQVADDKRIFQMVFGRSADFAIPDNARVRLVLTNTVEIKRAILAKWPDIGDVQTAVAHGLAKVMYASGKGAEINNLLTSATTGL